MTIWLLHFSRKLRRLNFPGCVCIFSVVHTLRWSNIQSCIFSRQLNFISFFDTLQQYETWYSYHKSSLNHFTYFIFWHKSSITLTLCSTVLKPTSLFADGIAWALVLLLLADKHLIANSDLLTKPLLAPSLTNLLTEQPTMLEELSNSCLFKAVCVA